MIHKLRLWPLHNLHWNDWIVCKHSLWFTLNRLSVFFFRYPQTTKLYFKRSLPYVYWARGNFKGALQAFVDLYKGPSATGIYSNKPVIYITWLLTTFPELSVIVKISCYAKFCLTDKTEKSACLSLLLNVVQNIWHFISYIFFLQFWYFTWILSGK